MTATTIADGVRGVEQSRARLQTGGSRATGNKSGAVETVAPRCATCLIPEIRLSSPATDRWVCSESAGRRYLTLFVRWATGSRLACSAPASRHFRIYAARRAPIRRKLVIGGKTAVIGYADRPQHQKNSRFLIKAFQVYLRIEPSSIMLVAGDGDLRDECQHLAILAGLRSAVRFVGVRYDVEQLCWAPDLLLVPSRFEGRGVVVLEAEAEDCR